LGKRDDSDAAPQVSDRVFFKIIDNRRLYDKTGGTYATLEDVATAVWRGETVHVYSGRPRDASGIDITLDVLVDAFAVMQRNPITRTVTADDLIPLMRRRKKG
jgi:polyhydroxyalkanoate synthesis regulator protein